MAKKSLVVKASRPQKFKVRNYTRCRRCGRPRAVYRKFGLCRICLREMAHRGELPGVTKSSWYTSPFAAEAALNGRTEHRKPKKAAPITVGPAPEESRKPRRERGPRP